MKYRQTDMHKYTWTVVQQYSSTVVTVTSQKNKGTLKRTPFSPKDFFFYKKKNYSLKHHNQTKKFENYFIIYQFHT